jgi:D-lactate dehydrogenase
VIDLIQLANKHNVPITFRAAGTSLSGQAVTDSVMAKLVPSKWGKVELIFSNNVPQQIKLQPGVIGGVANKHLGNATKIFSHHHSILQEKNWT